MGVRPAGQGSPAEGDREAAVGVTIFSDRSSAKGRQNGGTLPSLTRRLHGHHNGTTVGQAPFPAREFEQCKKGRRPVWTAPLSSGIDDGKDQSISGASVLSVSSPDPLPRERKSTLLARISVP